MIKIRLIIYFPCCLWTEGMALRVNTVGHFDPDWFFTSQANLRFLYSKKKYIQIHMHQRSCPALISLNKMRLFLNDYWIKVNGPYTCAIQLPSSHRFPMRGCVFLIGQNRELHVTRFQRNEKHKNKKLMETAETVAIGRDGKIREQLWQR